MGMKHIHVPKKNGNRPEEGEEGEGIEAREERNERRGGLERGGMAEW